MFSVLYVVDIRFVYLSFILAITLFALFRLTVFDYIFGNLKLASANCI